MSTLCTFNGCTRPRKAQGLCATHYMRLRRRGDPGARGLSGRPRNPVRAAERATWRFWSERTFDRYWKAVNLLNAATGDATPAIAAATRPNGSMNIALLVRLANAAAVRHGDDAQREGNAANE